MHHNKFLWVALAGCALDVEPELGEITQELGAVVALNTYYNPTTGDHAIATSSLPGYSFVRTEGRVFSPNAPQPPDTVPLNTWYGAARGDYQTITVPRDPNYTFVRLEGYVHTTAVAGTLPLQSWWSPSRADNYATTNPVWTHDTAQIVSPDYDYVRTEGYVFPPASEQPPATKQSFRWGTMGGSSNGARGSRDLLVLAQTCNDVPISLSNAQLDQLAFGPGFPNVRDFSLENSNSRFSWRRGGVAGPYLYPDDPDTSADESSYHQAFGDGASTRIAFAQLRGVAGGRVASVSLTSVATDGGTDGQEVFGFHDFNGGALMPGDIVAFKTNEGRWLREVGGTVTADATSSGTSSRFQILRQDGGTGEIVSDTAVTLMGTSGRYLYEDTLSSTLRATFTLTGNSTFTLRKHCCPDIERTARALITRAAAAGYDFSIHDHDGDGVVEGSELSIAIIQASPTGRGGSTRWVRSIALPGITIAARDVSAMGEHMSFMTLVHELLHHLGAIDLYGLPGGNYSMSTMSATIFGNPDDRQSFMLDPWHRIRLGWVDPDIHALNASGASQSLYAPDLSYGRPLVIYDPDRYSTQSKTGDFFLVEYRTNGRPGYDQDGSSVSADRSGIAMWQIREGSLIVETFAPNGVGGSQLWDAADGTFTPLYADGTASPFRLRVGPTAHGAIGASVEWTDDGLLRPRIDGGTVVIRPGQIAFFEGMFSVDRTGATARFVNLSTGAITTVSTFYAWTSTRVDITVPTLPAGDYEVQISRSGRWSNARVIEVQPPL